MKRDRQRSRSDRLEPLRPRRSLGQHFLRNEELLAFIAKLARLRPGELVLEVGPGPGNLTRHLLESGAQVVAVEIDERFSATVPDALGKPKNLHWLQADVLAGKNAWNPSVTELIDRELCNHTPLKLAANLPYSVAVPLLSLLCTSTWPLGSAVVTVQLEVAQRLVARPGGKDYGPISVAIRLSGEAHIRKRVGRGGFSPPPKVDSAIVEIAFEPHRHVDQIRSALALCRQLFPYRRKTLRASLLQAFKGEFAAAQLDSIALPFGPARRLETMAPEEFVLLARELGGRLPPS